MVQQSRKASRRSGDEVVHPVKGGEYIRRGALCLLDGDGNAVAGKEVADLTVAGICQETIDNRTGSDGMHRGVFSRGRDLHFLSNDNANPVLRQHLNKPCYVVNDETVSSSHNNNARSEAGIARDVTSSGVFVEFV
ncbi:hypothetical protein PUV47_01385 [Pseudovibrio exalbescens]|uniref:hypothetical protein n=1 Tax=Pseudovibrio exalbescens TaxID=197461 RepID=UPI002365FE29|nr:hypothetical protein [Pseudovibrio exalbescens]MDD7908554.1 hypothetical protein [Pseudovibrio exalbescens]